MCLLFLAFIWSGDVFEATARKQIINHEAERQRLEQQEALIQQRQRELSVNRFLSNIDGMRVGQSRGRRLREFLLDVREFSFEIRGLYMLRYAPMESSWAQEDLRDGTRRVEDRARNIQRYAAFGADVDSIDPAPIPSEDFFRRLNRLYVAADELIAPLLEVTQGDVLDLELLAEVHQQLALILELSHALGETEF